jgi:hypothetical protein
MIKFTKKNELTLREAFSHAKSRKIIYDKEIDNNTSWTVFDDGTGILAQNNLDSFKSGNSPSPSVFHLVTIENG